MTPWTVARQAPLSMGFFRQEYRSGLPCPPAGDLPDPGIKLASLMSSALANGFFTNSTIWKAQEVALQTLLLHTPILSSRRKGVWQLVPCFRCPRIRRVNNKGERRCACTRVCVCARTRAVWSCESWGGTRVHRA